MHKIVLGENFSFHLADYRNSIFNFSHRRFPCPSYTYIYICIYIINTGEHICYNFEADYKNDQQEVD